jgi:surface antigen
MSGTAASAARHLAMPVGGYETLSLLLRALPDIRGGPTAGILPTLHTAGAAIVRSFLMVCVASAGFAAGALAQVNPFGPYSADHLTADDRRLAEAASREVVQASAPRVGEARSWSNSASGNSGTITLVEIHDYQGMPCRTLQHSVQLKERAEPVVFRIDRCRTQAGEWKIL